MATAPRQGLANVAGSGRSTLTDTTRAAEQALDQALRALGGASPTFGFLFVSPKHDLATALGVARRLAADATFTTGVDHILSGGAELAYGRKTRKD